MAVMMILRKLAAALAVAAFFSAPSIAADGMHLGSGASTQFYTGGKVDVTEAAKTILAAAGEINVDSQDIGEVIAAGGRIVIHDIRTNEIIAAGGHVAIDGVVNRDVVVAGGSVVVNGEIGGDLIVASGNIEVSGHIKGDVRLRGGDITIAPGTVIDGDLNYRANNDLVLPGDAHVGGTVGREGADKHAYRFWEHLGVVLFGFATLAAIGFIVTLFVFAFVVLLVLTPLMTYTADAIDFAPVKAFGYGLLTAVMMPVIFVMLLITLIGIPLALLCIAIFPIIYGLGLVSATHWIGMRLRRLMRPGSFDVRFARRVMWTFAGVVVFVAVGMVPFVGTLIQFVMVMMGLGALALRITSRRVPSAAAVPA